MKTKLNFATTNGTSYQAIAATALAFNVERIGFAVLNNTNANVTITLQGGDGDVWQDTTLVATAVGAGLLVAAVPSSLGVGSTIIGVWPKYRLKIVATNVATVDIHLASFG